MVQDQATEAIETAAKVVEQQPESDIVELSNGIRLRYKAVPLMTLRHAMAMTPKPTPPMVESPEKGRMEPWEGDPRYQEAVDRWQFQLGETTLNIMLALGTKLEFVPEGIEGPNDTGWIETMEAIGVPIKLNSTPARYLSWLRFYALADNDDVNKVSIAVARRSGVLESDVTSSLQSFRSGEDGGTDLPIGATEHSADGDNLPPSNGRTRARSRGKG